MKSLRIMLIGFALAISASSFSGCSAQVPEPDQTEVAAVISTPCVETFDLQLTIETRQLAEVESCMSSAIPDLQVISFSTAYPLAAKEAPRVCSANQVLCFTIDGLACSQKNQSSINHLADRPRTFNPFLHVDPGSCS